jgi:hypothetical protein
MAEKENGEDPQVNLEMPSIGFGRKKRRKESEDADDSVTEAIEPVPAPSPEPWPEPSEETRPLYVDDVPPQVPATEAPIPEALPAEAAPPVAAEPAREPAARRAPKPPRAPRPPLIPGLAAAILTGAVVGGLTVGLTYLALQGCEAARGTDSCGGPGFFILIAIMVLAVVTGGWLLKFFQVTDPGSTSFLAVGLAVVIALLFLIDVIFEWWMVIAMPLVFVATYALAHWVTVRYIEPADHG